MLATPLRAGMSRSAKEFVATRADNSGAVVLSEFCATAEELPDAFLVNPYDVEGHRRVIGDALRASPTDLRGRMAAMRRQVQTHDVHQWAGAFLAALGQRAIDRCQVVRLVTERSEDTIGLSGADARAERRHGRSSRSEPRP
jgi:trehalose-6-phosphate synthase